MLHNRMIDLRGLVLLLDSIKIIDKFLSSNLQLLHLKYEGNVAHLPCFPYRMNKKHSMGVASIALPLELSKHVPRLALQLAGSLTF